MSQLKVQPMDGLGRVIINASGTNYEMPHAYLEKFHLYKVLENSYGTDVVGEHRKFTIDRPAESFGSIVAYLQTGELHMPTGVCPGAFRRELEYWNVDPHVMKSCCLYRYQAFLDDEETRHRFLDNALTSSTQNGKSEIVLGSFGRFRMKLWNLVNNDEVSVPARVYFTVISLMVMVSVLSLALSTEPSMRRGVSECEHLEYLKYTDDPDIEKYKFVMGYPDCSGSVPLSSGEDSMDTEKYDWTVFELQNGTLLSKMPYQPPSNPLFGRLSQKTQKVTKHVLTEPDVDVPLYVFYIVDMILILFFTFDLALRLMSCPCRRRYLCSPVNVFDVLALIGNYSSLIVVSIEKQYRYVETPWLLILKFLLVFRILRLFRVVKNVRASKVLAYSLTQNVMDMSLLVLLLFIGISAFACLFYFSESRDTVSSIPVAWYWAIITMTTVGYGDISPSTGVGRGVATICAICGVLLLAVTLPMFVNNFLSLYQYSCVNESIEKNKEKREKESRVVQLPVYDVSVMENVVHRQPKVYFVKPLDEKQEGALY